MLTFITDESELLTKPNTFGIYFYSRALPLNHKKILIMIDKVIKKYKIPFYAVDIDSFKTLVKRFDLESVPTVIGFVNKKEKDRIVGVWLTKPFDKMFKDLIIGD